MKKRGTTILGLLLAIPLLIGLSGVAMAVPVDQLMLDAPVKRLSGTVPYATYKLSTDKAYISGYAGGEETSYYLSLTEAMEVKFIKAIKVGDPDKVEITMSLISAPGGAPGTPFTITGTLTDYESTRFGYAWDVRFERGGLSGLSPYFELINTAYIGSIAVSTSNSTGVRGFSVNISAVPVPPSALLLAPGLLALVAFRRRNAG